MSEFFSNPGNRLALTVLPLCILAFIVMALVTGVYSARQQHLHRPPPHTVKATCEADNCIIRKSYWHDAEVAKTVPSGTTLKLIEGDHKEPPPGDDNPGGYEEVLLSEPKFNWSEFAYYYDNFLETGWVKTSDVRQ